MLIPRASFINSHSKPGESIPVLSFISQCSFYTDNFGVEMKTIGMF